MTFINGSYDIPTIISTIGQGLAATDDFTTIDNAAVDNHGHVGYCVKHTPTNTYVTFIAGWATSGRDDATSGYRANRTGIRVIFSNSFDTTTHTYTSADKIEYGIVPLFHTYVSSNYAQDVSKLYSPNKFGCSLWIDKQGVIASIQNNYGGSGCFFALEFFPQNWVEYNDSETQFAYLYCLHNTENWGDAYRYIITHDRRFNDSGQSACRPFRFMYPTYPSITNYEGGFKERQAYRSEANNKIYFKFHTYENDVFAARKPFAETRRWFRVSVTGGLQVGDILNWIDPDGVTVHKYIVTMTCATEYYAIPYQNAFEYPSS